MYGVQRVGFGSSIPYFFLTDNIYNRVMNEIDGDKRRKENSSFESGDFGTNRRRRRVLAYGEPSGKFD